MPSRQATWPPSARQGVEPYSPPLFRGSELDLQLRPNSVRSPNRVLELDPLHEASLAVTPTPDVTPEGIAAWRAQITKASKAERDMFLQYKAADLEKYTAAIEKTVLDHGKDSRALRVARLLNPLFQAMNMYAPIAQTMMQADPTSSPLILGGITCIMAISSRFLGYQEKVAKMLSEMLKKLDILVNYDENIYENNAQMQKAIMEVFGDVLDFCIQASRMFLDDKGKPRSSFKAFVTSLGKPFESKFSDVLSKFDMDIKAFEEAAVYVDRERNVADRRRMGADRAVASQFMQYQVYGTNQILYENNQIQRGVDSIGRQMSVANQRQREGAEKEIAENLRVREEKRRKVIAWVPSIPFHEEQEGKFEKRLQGTGEWLLDNKTFQQWEASSDPQLLWVHGKNGSGKSYLAARVVQYLSDSAETSNKHRRDGGTNVAVAYIYPNSLAANTIDHSKLIGSILHQLCHLLPHPEIEQSLETLFDRQTEPPTRHDMQRAILSILARFSRAFIVVDGLDECHKLGDGPFRELCEFVNSLVQLKMMTSVTKVVVFSRPEYLEIKKAFGDCPKIQVDAGANDDDIKESIVKEFSAQDLLVRKTPELLKEVEGALLSGADGMFLWVDLLVKNLRGSRTLKELRAKLKGLPQTLEEAYDKSMRRVADQEEYVRTRSMNTLLWITNTKRALSREELKEALAIEPGITELDDDNENKIHDDAGFAAECGDLVYLADGQYHLLHSSLKDYLTKKLPMSGSSPLKEYIIMQKDAARVLAETCLTYLNFKPFRNGPLESMQELTKMLEEHPFLRYAANYWGNHVAEAKGSDFLELAQSFLSSDGARELSMQILSPLPEESVCPYPGKTTPLHFLSIFNLVEIARELSDTHLMKSNRDGFNFTPLDYALVKGSREIAVWLLRNVNESTAALLLGRCAPVHAAASRDWGDIVERLLELGHDEEAKFGERQLTPLHAAASHGSESALTVLLKASVNVNCICNDGTTPLIDAVNSNHPRLVTLLLEAGADVNVRGWDSTTALHCAARNSELSILKALFEKGAEVDPVSGGEWDFSTPLHIAASNGHHEAVESLIQKGADVNKCRPDGYTALLLTCSSGFPACLELLIKENARIDARSDKEQTCFHLAAMNGYSNILKILFEKCPDSNLINSTDQDGNTPLHSAIWSGKKAEAKFLLGHGALVDKLNNDSNSALQAAIIEGQTEIGELLLNIYGADASQKDVFGSPALHYAAHCGRCDFIPLLLKGGAEPNFENSNLDTALHFAANVNSLEFIKLFFEAVPTLDLAPKNRSGQTPLHMAASGGHSEIVKLFLKQKTSSLQAEDDGKNLPLHEAAWNGHLETVKLLLNDDNINSQGYLGETALHRAAYRGHPYLVKFLLGKNADANKLNDYQGSPLFVALLAKHVDVANILLDHRADPKIANKYGETALHRAAQIGDERMVRRLLGEHYCDGLYTSEWGVTPFMGAVSSQKVEVVDAFLEYSFNGTAIPDTLGKTCIHVAAETGSIEMLNKLTTCNDLIALATDYIGRDALHFAAEKGHIDMIEPLRNLSLGLNGSKRCPRRPLGIAASEGYYDFVCRLIELGADVNERVGLQDSNALHGATACRFPLIVERLIEAGADPTCRDALGLSSLDYAFQYALVWEKMGDARDHYSPIELQKRIPTLRKTVQKCVGMILALPQEENPKTEFERLDCLSTVARALFEMGSEQSQEHARICCIELASPPESAYFGSNWVCDICSQTPICETRYLCVSRRCERACLCSLCYSDYLKGGGTPKSIPRGLKILQKLEDDLKPIREIGKIFVLFRAGFLYKSCEALVLVVEWFNEKLKAYGDWEKTYNKTGRFDTYKRPGQIFLKIVEDCRKLANEKEKEEGENTIENRVSKIEEELTKLYREHKPDKGTKNFICSGHDYMEICDKSTIEDVDRKCFSADWKLTTEWLSALLEFYKDDEIEREAGERAEGPDLPIRGRGPEAAGDQVDESSLAGQMAVLTSVLTDEPMEITTDHSAAGAESSDCLRSQTIPVVPSDLGSTDIIRANTDLKANGQDGHAPDDKNDSGDNDRQLRNETTSAIKPSVDTENAPRVLFGSSPNRQRLLNIGQELRRQMIEVLEAAKAAKKATKSRDHIDGRQSGSSENSLSQHKARESLANEDQAKNQRQDSQEQNSEEIKEKHAFKQDERIANHDAVSNVKEGVESGSDEEENLAWLALNAELRWRETAWQFAQIILYGSVEDSLIDTLISKNDSGEREIIPTVDEKEDHGTSTEAEGKATEQAEMKEQVSTQGLRESAKDQNDGTNNKTGEKEGMDEDRTGDYDRTLMVHQVEKAHEKKVSEL